MSKILPRPATFALPAFAAAQTTLSGRITNAKGHALGRKRTLRICLKDTYDGAFADAQGRFSFAAAAQGYLTLAVGLIGYEPAGKRLTVTGQPVQADFTLRECVRAGERRQPKRSLTG